MVTIKKKTIKKTPVKAVVKAKKAEVTVTVNPVWSVISLGGTQYTVRQGEIILVDRQSGKKGNEIKIEKVHLLFDGRKLHVGEPYLPKASVVCEVLEELRGPKIDVFRFKAKSRYRKRRGHRQELTRLKVKEINYGA